MDFLSVSIFSKMKPEPYSALLPRILLAFMASEIIIFIYLFILQSAGEGGCSYAHNSTCCLKQLVSPQIDASACSSKYIIHTNDGVSQ